MGSIYDFLYLHSGLNKTGVGGVHCPIFFMCYSYFNFSFDSFDKEITATENNSPKYPPITDPSDKGFLPLNKSGMMETKTSRFQ